MHFFTKKILSWYAENKRDLPWRSTRDPYKIWVSEVILQQTRVNQGTAYYHSFIQAFPTVRSLAAAPEEQVLKLWQGLGYYTRARNMHATARKIIQDYKGVFPNRHDELIRLKGIGEYTAAAVSSIAYGECRPVVDGNVIRVLSRFFAIADPIGGKTKKRFYEIAGSLIDKEDPATFNQAVMEFGALYCKPRNPACKLCCLRTECLAFKQKKVSLLPVKDKKISPRKRYFNYFIIREKASVFIRKRTGNDIWKNLYEFPMIETKKNSSLQTLMKTKDWVQIFGTRKTGPYLPEKPLRHILSHQVIYARFWVRKEQSKLNGTVIKQAKKIKIRDFEKYAVPRPIEKFFREKFHA